MGPDYVVGLGRNIIGDIREQLVSKFLGLKKDHIIIMINCELTMEKHNEIFLKSQKGDSKTISELIFLCWNTQHTQGLLTHLPLPPNKCTEASRIKTLLERCKCSVIIELHLQRSR